MLLKFYKVTSLPGTLTANAMYFVLNGNYSETYITNSSGEAKSVGNSTMINTLVNSAITSALADQNMLQIVADITARNALASGSQKNLLILVTDATGDVTVSSGAALYAYNEANSQFTKLSEYESMDATVAWANITGKPTSSVANIDDAVSKRHSHTNQASLDKIGEDGNGNFTYNGEAVGAWGSTNW